MILLSLLAAMTLIALSKSTPLSYATYRRRDVADGDEGVYIPYLIDGASVNDIYWPPIPQESPVKVDKNSPTGIDRVKKIRSLSVTNSLDVLRQRVALELARRKALQDQKQIDANRRFLDNIGKRSSHHVDMGFPQILKTKNGQIFDSQLIGNQRQTVTVPKNSLHRTLDWYNVGDVADPYNDDDQLQKTETNELRLL